MTNSQATQRATAALKNAFIADSLAMPVHWYYNPGDIFKQFPDGISQFEDAPKFHPCSIMSAHSTQQGGRTAAARGRSKEIVGDVILKGKRQYWGIANQHYHQGMKAGENTLNAHCARALLRSVKANDGTYSRDSFLDAYIDLLTADEPLHPDTYAESYHRGFFANQEAGKDDYECGAVTHDTASVGGLVTLGPLALVCLLQGADLDQVQATCRTHLQLTHPDHELALVSDYYVELLQRLLQRETESAQTIIADIARRSIGLKLAELAAKQRSDFEIVGGLFTSACYISGSWPSVLYFAYKYAHDPKAGLLANTNVGGDNVHRGSVLGLILGLINGASVDGLFSQLTDAAEIEQEIFSVCNHG
jgi:ADP-ribosylglycohydrolase